MAIAGNSHDWLKPFNRKKIPLEMGLDTFTL